MSRPPQSAVDAVRPFERPRGPGRRPQLHFLPARVLHGDSPLCLKVPPAVREGSESKAIELIKYAAVQLHAVRPLNGPAAPAAGLICL